MEKLIELNTDPNILVSSTILNYNNPEYISVPILQNSNILVKQGDLVKIGTPIIKYSKGYLTSSVSGKVSAIKKVTTITKDYDAIIINNDYEEKNVIDSKVKRSLKNISKENISKALRVFGINIENKENIILNCIDDEPYVLTNNFYLFMEYPGFLELLDKLSKIYPLKKVIIALKSTSSNNISKLMDSLGMYPNITLNVVPNLYLLGNSKFLTHYLGLNEKSTEVINAKAFYKSYNYLKKNKLVSEVLLTVSGTNTLNPSIIKVKIGSKLSDVLSEFIKVKDGSIYIGNGLMKGKIINPKDFIITEDLDSILIMKQKNITSQAKCINCGACIDICPVGINPLLLNRSDYKESVKDICLNCGLCSYICPVHINFKERLEG